MILEMVKLSYQEAFLSIRENVAVTVDGVYTRVFINADGTYDVKKNNITASGKVTQRKVAGKKAKAIFEYAMNNMAIAK